MSSPTRTLSYVEALQEAVEQEMDRDEGVFVIGLNVDDLDGEIRRLEGLGAELMEGIIDVPNGPRIAFIKAPDDVRIELLQLPG